MQIFPSSHEPPQESRRHIVYARSGWQMPTLDARIVHQILLGKRPYGDLDAWTRDYEQRYGITARSRATLEYNCLGMVFAGRRTWIEDEDIVEILVQDGYREIQLTEVMIGDVVVYYNYNLPVHVGIICEIFYLDPLNHIKQYNVLSKWGEHAEFIHPLNRVSSNYGQPTKYYTDRQ